MRYPGKCEPDAPAGIVEVASTYCPSIPLLLYFPCEVLVVSLTSCETSTRLINVACARSFLLQMTGILGRQQRLIGRAAKIACSCPRTRQP